MQLLGELVKQQNGQALVNASELTGGHKHLECCVLVGAFNNLNLKEFAKAIVSIEWVDEYCVQLFLKRDYEDEFAMYPWGSIERLAAGEEV